MRTLVALTVLAVLLAATSAMAFREIRDGSGNLVGTERRVGDRIEIRDGNGNLSRQINREGSRTVIRDGSGNQVGEVDRNRGDDD